MPCTIAAAGPQGSLRHTDAVCCCCCCCAKTCRCGSGGCHATEARQRTGGTAAAAPPETRPAARAVAGSMATDESMPLREDATRWFNSRSMQGLGWECRWNSSWMWVGRQVGVWFRRVVPVGGRVSRALQLGQFYIISLQYLIK